MVTLLLDSTQLEIVLSVTEHALAFRKRNVIIERSQITKVQLTADAWTWLRGVADPGTYIPSAVAMGSWKSASGRDFAIIRRRRPSVVIDLEGHDEFQRLVLTTRHGLALVKALRLDAGAQFADVVDIVAAPVRKPRTAGPRPATA
ncbi:hypothetical protein GCM10022240_07530 [Microbacterium kribbense]|uniref:Uncharacterized protein n=1 Tax=Microbacterium kribbense TaxID=433645 RepID=A0ABP7GC74_9MICO